jgi:hypothetical protein
MKEDVRYCAMLQHAPGVRAAARAFACPDAFFAN